VSQLRHVIVENLFDRCEVRQQAAVRHRLLHRCRTPPVARQTRNSP
jgi:hypothetical protein